MRWLIAAVLAAAAVTAVPTSAAGASCAQAHGPFHRSSTDILQPDGTRYVPRGITVSGLEHPDWQNFTAHDLAEIDAAGAWCLNTVRLQVGQWNLNHDPQFVTVFQQEVAHAEAAGLVVWVNDQAQWNPDREPSPTAASKTFWRTVGPMYASDPQVVADVFNEPAGQALGGWACWHDGGSACNSPGFIGMQTLAALVRRNMPHTLIVADGAHGGGTLSQVRQFPIRVNGPFFYSIHHPDGPHTEANWDTQFGYLITQHIAPVTDGEWTNWAAQRAECWPDAPARVPIYLAWLARHHIGMTVWHLWPGVLVPGTDLTVPSAIHANWACVDGLNQSAGTLIRDWYRTLN